MLTIKETQLLNRVGPATIMGTYLRQQWLPVIQSGELVPGGQPVQVRLLGEELVVYREPGGQVGLVGAWCAHASAPMAQAANEDAGLLCGLHGWKFNRQGRCIYGGGVYWEEMFDRTFRLAAYPCVEHDDIVFAHMGAGMEKPPPIFTAPTWVTMLAGRDHMAYLTVHKQRWHRAIEAEIRAAVAEGVNLEFQIPWALVRRSAQGTRNEWRLWIPIDDEHSLEWMITPSTEQQSALELRAAPLYLPERRGWFYSHRWPVPALEAAAPSEPAPPSVDTGVEPPATPADVAVMEALQPIMVAARAFREQGMVAGR